MSQQTHDRAWREPPAVRDDGSRPTLFSRQRFAMPHGYRRNEVLAKATRPRGYWLLVSGVLLATMGGAAAAHRFFNPDLTIPVAEKDGGKLVKVDREPLARKT